MSVQDKLKHYIHLQRGRGITSLPEPQDHNMEAQQVQHLSFMSTWIFVFCFLAVCSGMDSPKLRLESTVFVAFAGEELHLNCELDVPANQSNNVLTCSNPLHEVIYECPIMKSDGRPQQRGLILDLKNLTTSGEYSCRYTTAKVYWYLRVRSGSHRDPNMSYFAEVPVVASFTGLLLVFSVVSSVYVFRGHGTDCHCGRKQKQKREERKEGETQDNAADVITSPTTSFYASLETRPRSIYDVLDHSAANREPDRSKAKPKKKEPKKKEPKKKEPRETVAQTAQDQHEGVFECVYENF